MSNAHDQTDTAAIATRIREHREDMGLSQSEVARRAGVSRHTVLRIEAGELGNFVPLVQVARVVGASLDTHTSRAGKSSGKGAGAASQEG